MAFMRSPVRSRSGPPTSALPGHAGVTTGGRVRLNEMTVATGTAAIAAYRSSAEPGAESNDYPDVHGASREEDP